MTAMNNPLIEYAGHPWVITEDALSVMASQIMAAAQGGKIPGFSIDSQDPESFDIRVVDGIAIIPVNGVMANDYGWTGYFSGTEFAGYKGVRQRVEKALSMPGVQAILLNVNSPGGTVSGCKECADFLKTAADVKPIYAWVNGQMTSGAYWLSSVSVEIAAPETAMIGSIGVVTMHADWSNANEKMGVKYTYITAGKYKAVGNPDEPLSSDGKDYIKDRLERLYTIFVHSISENRNMSPEKIAELEAKVLLAGPAKEAGLIDRLCPDIDTFISTITQKENKTMDAATLKATHPDTYAQVMAEGASAEKAKMETAISAAVRSALGLVKVVAGEEIGTKIEALSKAGITAEQANVLKDALGVKPPETTTQATATDEASRKEILDALKTASAKPVSQGSDSVKDGDFDALVTAHMAAEKCTRGEAMMTIQAKHPEAHKAWIKSQQK